MKRKDKELLLKDLCGRLPYGVKVLDFMGSTYELAIGNPCLIDLFYEDEDYYVEPPLKPYLRPLSSMTDKELEEAKQLYDFRFADRKVHITVSKFMDFLNKYHFDYNGLLPHGLAIEAPSDMYKEE